MSSRGEGSAQGIAAGILADVCGKSLSLTGTLLGGYSSTIFHLLYGSRRRFARSSGAPTSTAGYSGTASRRSPSASPTTTPVEDGRNSRRRKLPQGGPGAAGPRAQRVVPHHREHGVPAPRGRGLRPARLRGEDPRVLDGLGGGRDGLLPAHGLQHRVRGVEAEAGGGSEGWLQAAAGDLPANPARLPRRLHQGGDGLRPQDGRRHRASAAPVRGEALPEGEGAHRPGGRRAAGGKAGAGLRDPHGDQGHHRADGRHPHPARLPGGGDEGRRGGPEPEGGVGGGQGEGGHRRPHLPPAGWCRPVST